MEHCEQERRAIRLSAPRWLFSLAPGSMLPGSPRAASCTEPVARNGLSLARNSCRLSATSIPGSKLPACYFASFQVVSVPVRPSAPPSPPDCCPAAAASLPGPVTLPLPGSACRARCLHSPPGLLLPSGSKRSTAFAACRSACRIRPISFRSPPPVLMKVWAADHRSRSATFPPACCSSNLLEPFSLCSRCRFSSMPFRCGTRPFPRHLFGVFSNGYGDWLEYPLCIKRLPVILILRYCNRK